MADPVSQSQHAPSYLRSLYEGAVQGDFSRNESKTKTAAQIGVGLIPVVGQLADARDTAAAIREVRHGRSGSWANLGFALLGWVPAAGDFAKSAHKVGVRETLRSIGDSLHSLKNTWSSLWRTNDERLGEAGVVLYKPGRMMESDSLSPGTLGVTNRYGDIQIREGLDEAAKQSTLDHESVHSFFSPKFLFGQEFRANLGLLGYIESHLLRRTEEGLAEAWARFKKDGLSGVAEGWRFPYDHAYGIDPRRLNVERNILLGIGTTVISGGSALANAFSADPREAASVMTPGVPDVSSSQTSQSTGQGKDR